MKWPWLGYSLIATPILALVVLLIGSFWIGYKIFSPRTVRDFKPVAKWTKLQFPAAAEIIDGVEQGPSIYSIVAKIEMPRAQIHAFISQRALKEAAVSRQKFTDDFGGLYYSFSEQSWTVTKPKDFISLRHTGIPGILWMLIDLDNPQTAMLYLYYVN